MPRSLVDRERRLLPDDERLERRVTLDPIESDLAEGEVEPDRPLPTEADVEVTQPADEVTDTRSRWEFDPPVASDRLSREDD